MMIRTFGLVLVGSCLLGSSATAQGPRLSELSVVSSAAHPPAQVTLPRLSAAERRALSTGRRTAVWTAIGAAAGFLIANVTKDEAGITGAELGGALAGAATGATFSLMVVPALWPAGS
jgi:hypothetical protein